MAGKLGVAKRDVRIVHGEQSRAKRLEVVGASESALSALGGQHG